MNTTACDPNIDWTECDHCKEFRNTMDAITAVAEADSTMLDQAYSEYYAARDAGHVLFGTETHRAWLQRLDKLEQQLDEINVAKDTAIEQWAECIHTHHQLHENRKRNTPENGTETEEMEEASKLGGNMQVFTISADKFVELFDQLENFYKARIKRSEEEFSHIDGAVPREGLKAVQILHRQLLRLIDEAKETHNASH